MTYGAMYNFFTVLLDKGGYPYLSEAGFDTLANNCMNILCSSYFKDFQKTQVLSDKISPLVTNFSLSQKTSIQPTTDLVGYWHLGAMEGLSKYTCNGKAKEVWTPIVALEGMSVVRNSVFNKPSEKNIYYTESNDLFVLLALGKIDVEGWYLKKPNKIDSENNSNTDCQFADDVCEEIVRMTEVQYSATLSDVQSVQVQTAINQQAKQGYDN